MPHVNKRNLFEELKQGLKESKKHDQGKIMLVTFDTQDVVNQLKSHGFTDEQAQVLTKIQKQVINDFMDNTLASKCGINGLKNNTIEVKAELKTDIQGLNTQLIVVKWMLGIIIAVEILPILKQLF